MALTAVGPAPESALAGKRRPWWRRHLSIVLGAAILTLVLAIAIFAPYLGTVDPSAISPIRRFRPPSQTYWFGSDHLGRDLYSRIVYGARASLFVGFAVAAAAVSVGLLVGMLAGFNRWVDAVLMRIMDGLMSIPAVLLAIALMALTKASLENVVVAIAIAEVPRVARLVRGVVLSLREQPFVEAAVASGTSTFKILYRHILPNTVAPLVVQATYICASAIITEAILSFIGAGLPPSIPTWGNIIAEGRAYFSIRPYLIAYPAILLSITVLAINLLGDGLRDALDPRLARRL